MRKLLTIIAFMLVVFTANAQNAGDKVDIMGRIGYCWNENETWSNVGGVITFNSVQWGGVAAWIGGEDWSGYSKVVYEFAEPTTLYTQIQLQRNNGDAYVQGCGTGSTSVEMTFDDKDVTSVSQIALQASGEATIKITAIYLVVGEKTDPVDYSTYTELITNGNCEGDDVSNFVSKEWVAGSEVWGAARIVADPTKNSNKCIEVVLRDIPAGRETIDDWDSQFFITTSEKLEPGDVYHITFKVRAEKAANSQTQAHDQPGQYNHWDMIGDIPFTTGWVEIEKNGTISEDQVPTGKELHTIAFNLAVLKEANKYYFDDISLKVQKPEEQIYEGYNDLITNGNCEGSETTNYISKEFVNGEETWGPSRLVTDPTKASNKCIEVVSRDIPAGRESIDDWDCQFFITVAEKLRPGDEYVISFKVRAEKAANSNTQAHNQPGQYNHWDMIGDIPFTTGWVNITKTGTISEDQVYKTGNDRDESNELHTIAFNLAVLKEANKYYFDDIKFLVKKAPVEKLIGDANGDGDVSVTDVTTTVDYILGNSTSNIVLENADVNGDGDIDIADVTLIVDIILNQTNMLTVTVSDTRYQKITGFGAAACDGAMCPLGTDTQPVKLLYGPESEIGLNIMRMEISPNFEGDVRVPEWGNWDTPYDWQGSVPSAQIVKQRGGIVFGTPWSPPGEYKTNGTAQGGNSESQGYQRGQLREDCYDKFFPWLNTFLAYMKSKGVEMDAVSIQNEPDWWVDYSGCLYTPQQQLNLVKNYAHMLDRQSYGGVRLISAEPLGFDPSYSNMLLRDETARNQIDIIAGHLYGHPPLGNMKSAATLAASYGKEVWMTEHSVSDNIQRLPNWHEQLLFAEEINECMLSGCTGYIFWYMRAHWSFVGTGEEQYNPGNTKNKLLPRAFVMSHFSKHVTGSTRLGTTASVSTGTNSAFETSAYIKGDSLIVMAIDTTKNASNLKLKLPVKVKSGVLLSSTSNESLCKETPISINKPTQELIVRLPERSLNTIIFIIDNTEGAASLPKRDKSESDVAFAPLPLEKATLPIP